MNHWLAEELTRLTYTERQRELEVDRLQIIVNNSRAKWSLTTHVALKLSNWLIATGERIQQRYAETIPASPWVENRKFAR